MTNSLALSDIPRPCDIGLPPQFTAYRPGQWEAIEHAVYASERFQALCLPTGVGKSGVGQSIQAITGERTVTCTASKGLMDQYMREFGEPLHNKITQRLLGKQTPVQKLVGNHAVASTSASPYLVDIRGKANYQCAENTRLDCADGARVGCSLQPSIWCTYHQALSIGQKSPDVVTNYDKWLYMNRQGRGFEPKLGTKNPVKILILDEAHLAPTALSDFLAVSIGERECRQLLKSDPPDTEDMKEWIDWAKTWGEYAVLEAKERGAKLKDKPWQEMARSLPEINRLDALGKRINAIRENIKDPAGWTCEEKRGRSGGRYWHFDPVWPGLYAERCLFVGVPKIILLSATLRPKTLGLLGVKNGEYQFREWPRQFPKHRSPIYHIPSVRMNWRTSDADLLKWVETIDTIIESRCMQGKRKGIIHTVSYARQEFLFQHSRHRLLFMGNTSDPNSPNAAQVVQQFKKSKIPCVLVSPSFSTGWDFPGTECEFQIIGKIPFPESKSKVMKERVKRDRHYLNYLAMQDLVQACGRGTRFELDRCETFIVDDLITWFAWSAKSQAPGWFEVREIARGVLPKLPPSVLAG